MRLGTSTPRPFSAALVGELEISATHGGLGERDRQTEQNRGGKTT